MDLRSKTVEIAKSIQKLGNQLNLFDLDDTIKKSIDDNKIHEI